MSKKKRSSPFNKLPEELEILLTRIIEEKQWKSVATIVNQVDNTTPYLIMVIQHICIAVADTDIALYIAPHCLEERLPFILWTVQTNLWHTVSTVLSLGVDATWQSIAIEEASERASDTNFAEYLAKYCHIISTHEIVLETLIRRRAWFSCGTVLKCAVKDSSPESTAMTGANHAEHGWRPMDIANLLLNQCRWQAVCQVLQQRVLREDEQQEVILKACSLASEEIVSSDLLPHCAVVIEKLIERSHWSAVSQVLQQRVLTEDRQLKILLKACSLASDEIFTSNFLPHCTSTALVETFIEQSRWSRVSQVLQCHILREDDHEKVLLKVCSIASEEVFTLYFLQLCESPSVFKNLIEREYWPAVSGVLAYKENGISRELKTFAIEEASRRADVAQFQRLTRIVQACHADHFCQVLHRAEKMCNPHMVHGYIEQLGWSKPFEKAVLTVLNEKNKDNLVADHLVYNSAEKHLPSDIVMRLFSLSELKVNRDGLIMKL
jgi:hypothetical protein